MQNLTIDGTTYKLKFDRDILAFAKLARKPYKPAKPKDLRKFPKRSDLSTLDYIRAFEQLNSLVRVDYDNASATETAQYDIELPLMEILENDAN
jgi:hypothetical protein